MSFLWALLWNGFGWPEYSAEKGSSFWFSWMYWHSLRARAARRRRAASPHAAGCPRGRPGASRGARGGQRRGARAWRRPPISSSPFCTCSRPPVSGRPHSLLWRASPGSWRRAPARRPPRTSGSGARLRPRNRQPAPPLDIGTTTRKSSGTKSTLRPGLPQGAPGRAPIDSRCDGGPRVPICERAENPEERLGRLRLSRLAAEMVRCPARAPAPAPDPAARRMKRQRRLFTNFCNAKLCDRDDVPPITDVFEVICFFSLEKPPFRRRTCATAACSTPCSRS
jgi:hypothetical protein